MSGEPPEIGSCEDTTIACRDVRFCVVRKGGGWRLVAVHYVYRGIPVSAYMSTVVDPQNRSFFIKTMMLYRLGLVDCVVALFRSLGIEVGREEVEERYASAEGYARASARAWSRIRRAWSTHTEP